MMSATASGFTVAVISNPIDVVRTRLMTFNKQHAYTNAVDCCMQTLR